MFLAQTFGVEVFAVDLWTSATENLVRFQQAGVSHLTVPLQFDALQLPFAEEFFDAVVSVDAYHYFGNNDVYFKDVLKPVLKRGGIVAIAFPGMKYEVQENLPEEMKPFWEPEALEMWHSINHISIHSESQRWIVLTKHGRIGFLVTTHMQWRIER